ncbi:DUF3408 domain-containing protein [Flavobacterium sp. Arc3]|uniref:DUF3408 domain-containing protein n=1 Tax=Flavobacterium sp. Arc3 TaxID=3046686 RepID=UPI00352C87D4
MKGNDRTAREGKSVYIIPEFHERLQRIVHVIGGNKLTIFNYLHNILEQHFNEYGEDIKAIFNEKQKPIL